MRTEAVATEKGTVAEAMGEACRAFQAEPGERVDSTAGGAEAARAPRTAEARGWEEEETDWDDWAAAATAVRAVEPSRPRPCARALRPALPRR